MLFQRRQGFFAEDMQDALNLAIGQTVLENFLDHSVVFKRLKYCK